MFKRNHDFLLHAPLSSAVKSQLKSPAKEAKNEIPQKRNFEINERY